MRVTSNLKCCARPYCSSNDSQSTLITTLGLLLGHRILNIGSALNADLRNFQIIIGLGRDALLYYTISFHLQRPHTVAPPEKSYAQDYRLSRICGSDWHMYITPKTRKRQAPLKVTKEHMSAMAKKRICGLTLLQ